jgi:hypothetical protein
MPGLDGFGTAAHPAALPPGTPHHFITAPAGRTHACGYSLGAGIILAPVEPDVLKTKVMVFVELFKDRRDPAQAHAETGPQTQRLTRRPSHQLALSIDRMLPS